MTTTMHQLTIVPLERAISNLRHILEVGAKHAEENGYDSERLTELRLFPDMLPLRYQVYIATDISKFAVSRLSGTEAPSWPDVETSFEDLIKRVDTTLEYLKSADENVINGTEDKEVTMKMRSGELTFNGRDYAQAFVLPNVLFHVTTAYAILRTNGVVLGKRDFLNSGT